MHTTTTTTTWTPFVCQTMTTATVSTVTPPPSSPSFCSAPSLLKFSLQKNGSLNPIFQAPDPQQQACQAEVSFFLYPEMSNRFLTLFCRKSSVQRVQEDMAADQAGPPKKPTRYFFSLSGFCFSVWFFGFSWVPWGCYGSVEYCMYKYSNESII